MQSEAPNSIPGKTKRLKPLFFLIVLTIIWLNIMLLCFMEPFSIWTTTDADATSVIAKNKNTLNIDDIRRRIHLINVEQKIYNEKRFGPLHNDSLVIVVQVYSRKLYLKHLISSLRVAKGISNVLIVFSHDYFDEEINDLIQSIQFCKVMQIFYPYSIQIYLDKFPGSDSSGCSSDISAIKTSTKTNINEFYIDDENETCRNPRKLQVKHHWWWKTNRIFNLTALKTYEKSVLFLEDDFYLVEDFIPVLKLMESISEQSCQNCKIMSLAMYQQAVELDAINILHSVTISNTFNNMVGLAFNRATWLEILQCRRSFCIYNEYNWDFSLKNVLITCMKDVRAMTVNTPRLYHFGSCGMHFKAKDCDPTATLVKIYKKLSKSRYFLYPKYFKLVYELSSYTSVGGPYGGWSDSRDQALCLLMSETDVTENLTASFTFVISKHYTDLLSN